MSDYLTTAAVAERWDLHTRTVLRYVEQGRLVGIRLPGGMLRFTLAEIEQREASWSTISPTMQSGRAQLSRLPRPGTEVEAPCS